MEDEIRVYDSVDISCLTGETESYDAKFFQHVIRKREFELIESELHGSNPKMILDYGCGGGWLSLFLLNRGAEVVGVDLSKKMVRNARGLNLAANFIVCDAMRLPFKDGVFDFIFGIAILHHLDIKKAINELKRISYIRSVFVFIEPNLLNPISALGRKFFPMKVHTKGEKQFTPEYLKTALITSDICVEKSITTFFLAFPLARLLKIMSTNPPFWLVRMTYLFEIVMEKLPGIRYINSSIFVRGKSGR